MPRLLFVLSLCLLMSDLYVSAYVYSLPLIFVLQFHQLNSVLLVSDSSLFARCGIQTFSQNFNNYDIRFRTAVLCFRVGLLVTNRGADCSSESLGIKTISQNFVTNCAFITNCLKKQQNKHNRKEMLGECAVYKYHEVSNWFVLRAD